MMTTTGERQMKTLIKAAFVEVLEETLKDIALSHAIEEGSAEGTVSGPVSHEEVFAIFRDAA